MATDKSQDARGKRKEPPHQPSHSKDSKAADLSRRPKTVKELQERRSSARPRYSQASPRSYSESTSRAKSLGKQHSSGQKKSRLALFVGIGCFVVAAIIAGFLIHRYVSADLLHKSVVKAAGMEMSNMGNEVDPDAGIDELTVNWDALREINPDIVGWVMIPGSRVNYPIVQADDNEYYLTHLFDNTYSAAGAIFLDSMNDPEIKGMNNFIYGHNLLDGSMFAGLKFYREKDYFDSHRTILLATPKMNYKLEVVACLVCDGDDKIRQFVFVDTEGYVSYMNMLLEYSVQGGISEAEIPDNLYCFVTCTDTNYSKRTVLLARIVEEKEPRGARTS